MASRPSRQLAFALRPLLGLALETTGLCPASPSAGGRRAAEDGGLPPSGPAGYPRGAAGGPPAAVGSGDREVLFSALSSLVEVVKALTPSAGKVFANLGREAVLSTDRDGPGDGEETVEVEALAESPRSEVVIELVSTAAAGDGAPPAAACRELGSLAFELAVVGAIVESKGGEFYLGSSGGDSRSFVVRLPVCEPGGISGQGGARAGGTAGAAGGHG